jgi:hypothetical protein
VLTAEGVTSNFIIIMDQEKNILKIFIPQALSDINLLKDLLVYILPAGMTVELARTTSDVFSPKTRIAYKDLALVYNGDYNDYKNGYISSESHLENKEQEIYSSYIPSLADLTTNTTRIIEDHTNDQNYRGMTTNSLVDSFAVNNTTQSNQNTSAQQPRYIRKK